MSQLNSSDLAAVATLGSASGVAFTAHAQAFGAGESTVDAQLTKGIARLQAIQSSGDPSAALYAVAIADGIANLTAKQAKLHNPTATYTGDR